MAKRPVFAKGNKEKPYYNESEVEFIWNAGMSASQKKKNVAAIHADFLNNYPDKRVLEISTKSESELGKALSAFNLKMRIGDDERCVESVYHGSKVFNEGGPFPDIIEKTPRDARHDERLKNSGALIGFKLGDVEYMLNEDYPRSVFYDWLYTCALLDNPDLLDQLKEYDAFTDIEFNPAKLGACQARTAAMALSLDELGLLNDDLRDFGTFLSLFR